MPFACEWAFELAASPEYIPLIETWSIPHRSIQCYNGIYLFTEQNRERETCWPEVQGLLPLPAVLILRLVQKP